MTQAELDLILASTPKEVVKALSISSFDVPEWDGLRKQYDPEEHAIKKNKQLYPVISNPETGADDMKRITRGLQKLMVSKVSQAMFSTPTERVYAYDENDENQKLAIEIIEEVYRTHNNIDSSNIERCKENNATCQVATIWEARKKATVVSGEQSKFKLTHRSYSEKLGYKLYPIIDDYGDLLVFSIENTSSSGIVYFDIYVNGTSPKVIRLSKGDDDWKLRDDVGANPSPLNVYPVVYTHLSEPVWGGESGTSKVELIEETISYRAMYVKKNTVPLAYQDFGELPLGSKISDAKESNKDKARFVKVGKGGKIAYVVWDVNGETVDNQIQDMEDAFFQEAQMSDNSFKKLLNSNTSADNKDIIMADSKAKALDYGGEWTTLFYKELNEVVIPNLKIMYPRLKSAFENISVRSIIKPFSARTDIEKANYVATAGAFMSTETAVRYLDRVDDVEAEVDLIEKERSASASQGF